MIDIKKNPETLNKLKVGTSSATPADGELLVSGNVGVGCDPSYPLEVQSGGVGTVLRAGTDFVSIDSTGTEAEPTLILNGDANTGLWHPAADTLAVSTGGAERMRISSSGDVTVNESVAIGTTPTAGISLNVRENSTTTAADIRNANASGFGLYVSGGSSSSEYAFRAANKDNTALFTVRGDGLAEFSNGIAFPAPTPASAGTPAASSVLDVYETGSWTPSLSPGSGSFTTLTYTTQRGRYIRVGSQVWCGFEITVNSFTIGTGASYVRLLGLPFDRAAAEDQYGTGVVTQYTGWNTAAPTTLPRLNAGDCILRYAGNAQGVANVPPSHINAGSSMNGFITFSV